MAQQRMKSALEANTAGLEKLVKSHGETLQRLVSQVVDAFHGEKRLILVGNGPQAGVAGIVATAFQHRLDFARPPLPAMALSHDTLLAGSLCREGNGRQFFSRQLRSVATSGDIVIVLTDAQCDDALVECLESARQVGCVTVAVGTCDPAALGTPPDYLFPLVSESAPRTLEIQLFFGHLLCELVEKELFGV